MSITISTSTCINSFDEVGTIIIPVLQRRKQRSYLLQVTEKRAGKKNIKAVRMTKMNAMGTYLLLEEVTTRAFRRALRLR